MDPAEQTPSHPPDARSQDGVNRLRIPRVGTLVVLAVLLLLSALFLTAWVPGRRQARAVAAIDEFGGSVTWEFDETSAPRNHEPPGPAWLWDWLDYNMVYDVVEVRFYGANSPFRHEQATDESLPPLLMDLPGVQSLHLNATCVTNNGLYRLREIPKLHTLSLAETNLRERDVDALRGLELKWLSLQRTWAGDEALESISEMTTLEYLDLTRTRVTDHGLHHLTGLENLKELYLRRCLVTREGAADLKRQLPDCVIYWEALDDPYNTRTVFDVAETATGGGGG